MSNATIEAEAIGTTTQEQLHHRLGRSRRAFARHHRALAATVERAVSQTRSATADYMSFVAGEGLRWKRFVERRREVLRSKAVERALLVQAHQALQGLQQQVERRVADLDRPTLASGPDGAQAGDEPPLADYGTMTARDVVSALSELDTEACRAVQRYEQAHKNRVTVLRAAQRRLAA